MKRRLISGLLIVLTFSAIAMGASAQIRMAPIFSDRMMFQQNTDAKVWGWSGKGSKVSAKASWSDKTFTAKADGDGKWVLTIPTPAASFDRHTITLSDGSRSTTLTDILVGEIWLCLGQSNMEMPMKGFKGQPVLNGNVDILKSGNDNLRFITVKRSSALTPQDDFTGEWKTAEPSSVKDFSATGYYFGKMVQEALDLPVGLVLASWGGSWIESWMATGWLHDFPEIVIPEKEEDIKTPNRTPTTLYNGMIHPIQGYTIRGAIMYQGESNYDRPEQYLHLFPCFVSKLRESWEQGEFPFYYSQIAPYDNPPEAHGDFNAAFLREAQLKASGIIPNSGMSVLMDIGEENCIHPMDKRTGGERLALLALGKTYGLSGFAYESPRFEVMEVKDRVAVLSFENAPMWMTSYGLEMVNFEIAGDDRRFYSAKARFNRSKVEVWSDEVEKPVAVRYAFTDYARGDLYGTEGLPVSSFRTDNWSE